jgi:hypothetical protein
VQQHLAEGCKQQWLDSNPEPCDNEASAPPLCSIS